MENIYKPKTDKIVSVRNALEEFQKELYPERLSRIVDSDVDIMEAAGLGGNNAYFDKLLQSVDVGQLSSPKDVSVKTFLPHKANSKPRVTMTSSKASRFHCVQRAMSRGSGKEQRNIDVKLRYNRHKYMEKVQDSESCKDLVPFREMVLIIRLYEPFKYKVGRRMGHPKFSQEYYVLGSQYLTELKDKFCCHCDAGPFYEISENRSQHPAEHPSKSGFFFIHDTFYNDLRDENNHDYSAVIQKWAERQSLIGELKSQRMEDVRFEDLQFRLGYPQLYQHQGNCEHLFVISDCRLLATSDVLSRARYPWLNSFGFSRNVPCNICGICEAQFTVQNSDRHIFDPAYICERCLDAYHYKDGKKIGDFDLYKFLLPMIRVAEEPVDSAKPSTSQNTSSSQ